MYMYMYDMIHVQRSIIVMTSRDATPTRAARARVFHEP